MSGQNSKSDTKRCITHLIMYYLSDDVLKTVVLMVILKYIYIYIYIMIKKSQLLSDKNLT